MPQNLLLPRFIGPALGDGLELAWPVIIGYVVTANKTQNYACLRSATWPSPEVAHARLPKLISVQQAMKMNAYRCVCARANKALKYRHCDDMSAGIILLTWGHRAG